MPVSAAAAAGVSAAAIRRCDCPVRRGPGQPHSCRGARLRGRPGRRHVSARAMRNCSRSSCITISWRSSCRGRIGSWDGAQVAIKDLGEEHFVAHHVASPIARASSRRSASGGSRSRCRSRCRRSMRSRSSWPKDMAWRCCRPSQCRASSTVASSSVSTCRSWPSSVRCAWCIARRIGLAGGLGISHRRRGACGEGAAGRYAFTRE